MRIKYRPVAVFCLGLFLFISFISKCQENQFIFHNITSEGTKYLNSVRTIFQDRYGYLWIGLTTGVVKYDGYEFKTYRPDINDSSSFQGRYVTTFAEDLNGDIWIGTQVSGVYHFKRDLESFVHYPYLPNEQSTLSHNEILSLFPDEKGYIWCISDSDKGFLDRINPKTRSVDHFHKRFNFSNDAGDNPGIYFDDRINSTAIVEDQPGSIWFGLNNGNGLGYYDFSSDSIRYYRNDDAFSKGLNTNTIFSIIKDNENNIWIGSSAGLHQYDRDLDYFIHHPEISMSGNEEEAAIYKIMKDSRGMLWLIGYSEVLEFDPQNLSYKRVSMLPRDQRTYFNIIGEVPQKGIWIDQSNMTYQFYSFIEGSITSVQNILLNRSVYELEKAFAPISYYLIDASGLLWIAINQKGIYKEDIFIRTFDSYKPEFEFFGGMTNTPTFGICEDPTGYIWISSNRGLFYFDPATKDYHYLRPKQSIGTDLQKESLHQIVSRENGELWINTEAEGILILDIKSFNQNGGINIAKDKQTFASSTQGAGLTGNLATDGNMNTRWSSIMNDEEWIYIDLGKNVNIGRVVIHWEFASGKDYEIQISNDSHNWKTIYNIKDRTKIGGSDYINLEGKGRYLRLYGLERATRFGFSIYEIEVFEKATFKHINYENSEESGFPNDTIYNVQKDSKDHIWLNSSAGLTFFDESSQYFITYSYPGSEENPMSSFYEDKNGIFWISTLFPSDSIKNFDPKEKVFNSYKLPEADTLAEIESRQAIEYFEDKNRRLWSIGKDSVSGDFRIYSFDRGKDCFNLKFNSIWNISGIVHEKEDLFWIAFFARGIQLIDFDNGEVIRTYDAMNGLNNLEILALRRFQNADLWIQYRDGFCRFDPQNETFITYEGRYGLQDIIYTNIFQNKQGYIYVPAMNGFNIFHPDSLRTNPNTIPPKIYITTFSVRGKDITSEDDKMKINPHISETRQIELMAGHNVFTIGFTGFHYGMPEGNTYSVFMEGVDEDWHYIGTEREVSYAGLSPGNYIFKVKSANADGIWNEVPAVLSIVIHPPWYVSWWSITSFILILGGVTMTLHKWRTSIHKKNLEKKQQELDEHKTVNLRLKQLDELKDQFLANTSHELRTPLNGIIGLADSLKDGVAGPQSSKAIQLLGMITASGKRLSNLINDILDFSKLKNNELKLFLKPVDVHSVADIVITMLQPLLKDRFVRLINNIPKNVPYAFADEDRLQQILINLVENAIKFTEEGSIILSSEIRDGFIAISVSDTGPGIPKNKQKEIFGSFEQIDMSISREKGGAGLGLAITKQLVNLHEGTITVASEEDKGSVFTFTIPLSEGKKRDLPELDEEARKIQTAGLKEIIDRPIVSAKDVEIYPEESKLTSDGEQMNILVVDDEPVNLQVLENYLSFARYNVTKAGNGLTALELLTGGKRFDLVILDVMMPKMSGFEVCNKIREKYLPNELPVIMLTVKNTIGDMVSGFNCGANDYLIKPFSKEELLSRVKTHINLHRINRIANRFVPTKFLQSIGKNSIMEVKSGDFANLDVTVFFSDIRKYTSISESMQPEENFRFIHAYVRRMGPIIHKHSGFINQYMGDAIMAIFPEETHHALNAAIQMQKKLEEYNKVRVKKGRSSIDVGMGMHCGPLTMGIIGDEYRSEPSTIADTVNIAARFEQLTKYYGARILLSQNSYNNLPEAHRYHIRYLGSVHVKGKKEILKVFECFDGDEEAMVKLKMQTMADFDISVKQFYNKDFPEAAVGFKKILKENKKDQVVKNFYNQSVKFSHKGVSENWTGIDLADSKNF